MYVGHFVYIPYLFVRNITRARYFVLDDYFASGEDREEITPIVTD